MEIVLNSIKFTATATMGELFANGLKIADTLEDTYRVLPPVCPILLREWAVSAKKRYMGKLASLLEDTRWFGTIHRNLRIITRCWKTCRTLSAFLFTQVVM